MIRGEAGRGQLKNKASRAWPPPELWRRCIPRAYLHFRPWHLQSSCIEPNPHRQSVPSVVEEWESIQPASQPHPALTFPRAPGSDLTPQSVQSSQPASCQSNLGQVCSGQGSAMQCQGSLQPPALQWQRQRSIARSGEE